MNAATPPRPHSAARPGAAVRLALYRQMLRVRMVEETIARLYAEQEMRCPTHLCIGQEAIPVGVSAHLTATDLVFSGHRSHGHYLAKGGDLRAMVAELYGRETGCARGKGGSQHLVDLACGFMGSAPILASTVSVGVGAAWGARMAGEDRVVVVYFGDAATEEGAFHEAMNFAAVRRLPVVFVCENNLYSVHSPLAIRQPPRPISALGGAHGVAAACGDGNDVEAVHALASGAVARARRGDGPTLLEFATYRLMEHCGPNGDLELGYRSAEEIAAWQARDPVAVYRNRLAADGALDAAAQERAAAETAREIDDAVAFAKASPFPAPDQLARFVYPETGR
ncbi:MAG: thiamine pyrophosphate-dependent dehydrogenase E1 component subunit alpha [Alphaproteobacteria bacterium]|nr:thiamine pyrophosphate-dependent dehydrogenase E1 component subunit alpha [Alphaproteobacteria bacterium]